MTTLFNGTPVQEGDVIEFINSDLDICRDVIRRRTHDNTLYFWNSRYEITDYRNAIKINPTENETYPLIIPNS